MNFAAGMSGGVAFVYDAEGTLEERCNLDMVHLCQPSDEEIEEIHALIEEHVQRTKSPLGIMMLYRFQDVAQNFVKVLPDEYERALKLTAQAEAAGKSHEEAVEIAFETMRKGE